MSELIGIELPNATALDLSIELQERSLDDIDETLFESCVRECDTIHVNYNVHDGSGLLPRGRGARIDRGSDEPPTRVNALRNWDGDMKVRVS